MTQEGRTWSHLLRLRDHIERHRQATGKLPASLAELDVVKEKDVLLGHEGRPCDDWGQPLVYQVEGDHFTLLSYGRDGKPGGSGIDADIYADPDASPPRMSLWDFTLTTTSSSNGVKFCALLAGLLTLPLCFLPNPQPSRGSLIKILVIHVVTGVFAVFTAMVMSLFHLSGH